MSELPHPLENWARFEKSMNDMLKITPPVWNPVTKRVEPWINMRKLSSKYCTESSCAIM